MLDALLCGLSEDEEYLVMEFLEELRAPQPVEGLTGAQSRLVRTLRAARGRILSKPFLVDTIAKNLDAPPDHKLIDVFICQIRKRRPDLSLHIENVWGQGLRWIENPTTEGD